MENDMQNNYMACDKGRKAKGIFTLTADREEKEKFLNGLKRYPEKGVPVYIDNEIPGPDDWEKLVQIREDNRFYMGDYVQSETGKLKEIRFDRVYLGEIGDVKEAGYKYGRKKKEEVD